MAQYDSVYQPRAATSRSSCSEVGCAQPSVKDMQAMRRLQTFFYNQKLSYEKALKVSRVAINNNLDGGLKIMECELPLDPVFGVRTAIGVAEPEPCVSDGRS